MNSAIPLTAPDVGILEYESKSSSAPDTVIDQSRDAWIDTSYISLLVYLSSLNFPAARVPRGNSNNKDNMAGQQPRSTEQNKQVGGSLMGPLLSPSSDKSRAREVVFGHVFGGGV
jgi:hypothetical protein